MRTDLSTLALSLPLLQHALAAPSNLDRARELLRRANPCEPGGTPVLYKEYSTQQCPPKWSLDSKGVCPTTKVNDNRKAFRNPNSWCTSYCEIRQEFTYGQEVPIEQPYCHGPMTCTVGTNKATSYAYKGDANIKWLEALGVGITGGFTYTDTTTSVETKSVKLDNGECGYFTFLPIIHSSCGSVSEGKFRDIPTNHCVDYKTFGNICNDQPYRSADKKLVLGDTVFVRTDCGNRQRLPMDKQDPAYQHEGVAQPQAAYDAFSVKFFDPEAVNSRAPNSTAVSTKAPSSTTMSSRAASPTAVSSGKGPGSS